MIRKDHVTRTPYQHLNHKSHCFNQSVYQHHYEQKQLTYTPKNTNSNTMGSQNRSHL
jgi:hypothetical protein